MAFPFECKLFWDYIFLELGPFSPTPIVSESSSPRVFYGTPMLSAEDNQKNIVESQAAEPDINSAINPVEDDNIKSNMINDEQITSSQTESLEVQPAIDQSTNEIIKPIEEIDSIGLQENELPYSAYPTIEETEIIPAPKLTNEVSQPEELLLNNNTIDDVISLPVKKPTNTESVKPVMNNEQKSIPAESQSSILEQKVASKPDCVETAIGCIKMPQPKDNNASIEPQ